MIDDMGQALATRMTLAEFLAWDETQDERHEFVDGEIFDRVGGSLGHARVVVTLTALIHQHLRGSRCEVLSESTKITVADRAAFLPDVMVACNRDQPNSTRVADTPVVVFEVVSPSSRRHDETTKLDFYRRIGSLRQTVIVDPIERTVKSDIRQADGRWVVINHTIAGVLPLNAIDLELSLADIFESLGAEWSARPKPVT